MNPPGKFPFSEFAPDEFPLAVFPLRKLHLRTFFPGKKSGQELRTHRNDQHLQLQERFILQMESFNLL